MTFKGIPIEVATHAGNDIYLVNIPPGRHIVQRQTGAQWYEIAIDPKKQAVIRRKLKPGQRVPR